MIACMHNFMIHLNYYCRDMEKCKKLFKDRFNIEASIKDCEVIRRVCVAVSTRAARLEAAGIVALVKKIKRIDGCTVAVDGSLYQRDLFPDRYLVYCTVTGIISECKLKSITSIFLV